MEQAERRLELAKDAGYCAALERTPREVPEEWAGEAARQAWLAGYDMVVERRRRTGMDDG